MVAAPSSNPPPDVWRSPWAGVETNWLLHPLQPLLCFPRQARTFAPVGIAFSIGATVGPAIGGVLATSFRLQPTFYAIGGLFGGLAVASAYRGHPVQVDGADAIARRRRNADRCGDRGCAGGGDFEGDGVSD